MNKILFSALSLLSVSAFANSTLDEIKWAPTNLRPLFLDNTITKEYCGREAIRFKGCAAAVEVFARFQNPRFDLVVNGSDVTLRESGTLLLKELNFRGYQDIQRKHLNEIEQNFSPETVNSLVELYQELRTLNPNPKPHEVALSLNESLAVTYDPHKQWVPLFRYNGLNHIRLKPAMGVETEMINNQLVVINSIVNSSAELAGIKSDDVILELNGEKVDSSFEFNFEDNQKVSVKVKRADRTFMTEVVFSYRKTGAIVDRLIQHKGKKYAYLSMSEVPEDFDAVTTCNIFSKFLKDFNQKTDGMILDLRNNVGGPGETAACISSLFLGKDKHIYSEVDFVDAHTEPMIGGFPKVFNKNMVVLVNASTASSGEIIASALQFHGRALILGDRTFGKAIGQIQEDYAPDKVALLFTSLKAYLPDGSSYHGKGVTPDVFVYRHGMTISERERETLREEDLALFPLQIEKGKHFMDKAKPSQFPKTCVQEKNIRLKLNSLSDTDWTKDFQLQFGLETLSCKGDQRSL